MGGDASKPLADAKSGIEIEYTITCNGENSEKKRLLIDENVNSETVSRFYDETRNMKLYMQDEDYAANCVLHITATLHKDLKQKIGLLGMVTKAIEKRPWRHLLNVQLSLDNRLVNNDTYLKLIHELCVELGFKVKTVTAFEGSGANKKPINNIMTLLIADDINSTFASKNISKYEDFMLLSNQMCALCME